MRKILSTIALTTLAILPLQADLQMTIMDKDGTQIKQCIKSYSFSNNLESIAKQKGLAQDVYSEEETLTNKILFGKPVYRKLFRFSVGAKKDFSIKTELTGIYKAGVKDYAIYIGPSTVTPSNGYYSSTNNEFRMYSSIDGSWISIYLPDTNPDINDNVTGYVVLEYTKISDTTKTPNTFKSYLHYIPSSSNTNEVVTHDLENSGVIFDKNYTYDSSTDSCTQN